MVEPTRFSYAESELIDGATYVIWFYHDNGTHESGSTYLIPETALVEYCADEGAFYTFWDGDAISPLVVHHFMHIPGNDFLFLD